VKRGSTVDRERAWQALVGLVTENLDEWRRDVAEATGLPFSRYRAMKRLAAAPVTLRALADAMGTDAPATTVIVNDLEARGLVRREPHPEDRRAKVVSLTAEGRRVLRIALAVPARPPANFGGLGATDVADLSRILERLRKQ
jgi:DNA-binding MarR family transcriptional regulator